MATELDQSFHGWPRQECLGDEDSQDGTIAQMLDQGSISFGRYAVETLAWEKRSVFTHNRFQEELERLKAPGLVAQKKAYFEAYYKRIRALKALQANEQTELVVDYGGDDHDSCKNGEVEDENFEHESLRSGAISVGNTCLKEHAAEAVFGMELSGTFRGRYSDSKSVVTCPDFSARNIEGEIGSMNAHLNNDMIRDPAGTSTDSSTASFKEIDMDKNSVDSLQCGHLDPETPMSHADLWRTDIEDAELKENCGNALQMGHISKESTLLDSPRRTEEIELLKSLCSDDDDEWNAKEASDTQYFTNAGTGAELNGTDSLMLKGTSKLPPVGDNIIGDAKVLPTKQISHSPTPRIKESVSSVRKTLKTECRPKSDAGKAPQQPKRLLQKTIVVEKNASVRNAAAGRLPSKNKSTSDTSYGPHKVHSSLAIGKEGNNAHFSNAQCSRLPTKNKSASVSSTRPLNGSPSNVTTSCSFSFATQTRSTTPGSVRHIGAQNSYSKSLNGSVHASEQFPALSTFVKRNTAGDLKTAGLEKKSHHGEILKTSSALNGHSAVPRARDGPVQSPEARSVILPAVCKYSLTSRVSSALKGERLKVGKTNAKPRLFEETSKIAAAPLARTNKTNIRKQVSSRTTGPLLDGKKKRQELKPWR